MIEAESGHRKVDRAAGGSLDDQNLIARFNRGGKDAFGALVGRYEGVVRAVLYRLVGNVDDAEDLAQETFIRVHGHLGKFRGDASLKTWILRIASNLARDFHRNRKRQPATQPLDKRSMDGALAAPSAAPGERLTLQEKTRALATAIESLPYKQRAALVMKIIADMNYREIAAVLGSTPNSVKANAHLARRKLIALLGEEI